MLNSNIMAALHQTALPTLNVLVLSYQAFMWAHLKCSMLLKVSAGLTACCAVRM